MRSRICPAQSETLWYLQEHPLLIAKTESPVALGEQHAVQLIGELRLPYMQIAPGQDGGPGMYVPNFVNQSLELTVTDRAAAAPELTTAVTPPPPKAEDDPFSLGLTLYSASAEFRAGWYDFDGLLNRVAELGIGPGIEIVASQVLPTYPNVTDDFVRSWQAAFDKHGFTASSFGANLDMGRRRDRDMTPDEEYEFTRDALPRRQEARFPARPHPECEAGAASPAPAARRGPRAQTCLRDPCTAGTQLPGDHEGPRRLRGA